MKRRLVQHPTYTIDASLADIRELVGSGAFVEHSLCMFIDESRFKHWTGEELKESEGAVPGQRQIRQPLRHHEIARG